MERTLLQPSQPTKHVEPIVQPQTQTPVDARSATRKRRTNQNKIQQTTPHADYRDSRSADLLKQHKLAFGAPWMRADERWTVHDGGAFVRDVQATAAGALHEASSTKLRGLISQMASFLDAPAIAKLGAGASGQVGLCKTVVGDGNEKFVARKRIHISAIAPSGLAQLEREVEVLKKLRHPHCIYYFGSCLNGDTLEILMEYAAGGALSSAIKSRRADDRHFGTPIVIRWLEQLMSAISHVHRKGILHRDIKASNIFLSEPLDPSAARIPLIKLGDFGLASVAEATGSRERSPCKCTAAASADKPRSRAKGGRVRHSELHLARAHRWRAALVHIRHVGGGRRALRAAHPQAPVRRPEPRRALSARAGG